MQLYTLKVLLQKKEKNILKWQHFGPLQVTRFEVWPFIQTIILTNLMHWYLQWSMNPLEKIIYSFLF